MNYPVFIPEFSTLAGRLNYGHISAVVIKSRTFFLTCYHLFGLGGGLRYPIQPTNLDKEILHYKFHDPLTDEVVVHDSKVLLIPNAKSMNPNSDGVDLGQDVAAFPVPNSYGGALFFPSYDPVQETEEVFLVTHNQHNLKKRGVSTVPLSCVEFNDDCLIAKFRKRFDAPGLSGAPIINNQDQYLGMIVGGADDPKNGSQYGLILPVGRIENILWEAGLV